METLFQLLMTALLLSFVFCCVASGFLQVRAWGRHTLPEAQMSFRALREVAYVSYGVLIIVSNFI